MSEPMRISPQGIDLIKRFEGLSLEAYQDIAGVWTIGYGHTGPEVDAAVDAATEDAGSRLKVAEDKPQPAPLGLQPLFSIKDGRVVITERQAEALLKRDLESREAGLNEWAADHGVALNQNEFDALISFIFNIGFAAFEGSTAAKRLKAGDRRGAANALTWWNRASVAGEKVQILGLTRRRAAEKALFLTRVNEICSS